MLKRSAALAAIGALGLFAGELRFCIRVEPKTFHPLQVEDESSETIRYLTGGVLIRLNRATQQLEGELATSWRVLENGRRIDLTLRPGVTLSDGTPFGCEDVAYTMRQAMDPALHSPVGDSFRSAPGTVETRCNGALSASIRLPGPVAGLAARFDQLCMLSARSPKKEAAVLGPFELAEYKAGSYVLLKRNPRYWKRDANGRPLPYLDSIRLDIQTNRELELMRFRRGEVDLVNKLDPEMFDRLSAEMPKAVIDAGPSLDWEIVFFNQTPNAPLPAYKRQWFRSTDFRLAISEAIDREDICRIVYRGHAQPAAGPVSSANKFWRNTALKPPACSPNSALARLQRAGFRKNGQDLVDSSGNKVEFSIISNAGNKLHERMMTMIQQDLAKVGIRVNVLTVDFLSLAERIAHTFNYESALMAFTNVDLDPSEQMNIWLSSAANHQWNPGQKRPETAWESEIDKLMLAQAQEQDPIKRKQLFDRLQLIAAEQAPFLFLVNPHALAAVSPMLTNVKPAALYPQIYWNAEYLALPGGGGLKSTAAR